MTTTQTDREMDARVAVEVMGWRNVRRRIRLVPPGWRLWDWIIVGNDGTGTRSVPPFSANLAAAWKVVAEMERRGFFVALDNRGWRETDGYWCEFASADYEEGGRATAPTAPLAICRAALAALDAEREG